MGKGKKIPSKATSKTEMP